MPEHESDEAIRRGLAAVWSGRKLVGLGLEGGGEYGDAAYERVTATFSAPQSDERGWHVTNEGELQFRPLSETRDGARIDRLLIFDPQRKLLGSIPVRPFPVVERLQASFAARSARVGARAFVVEGTS